MNINMANSFMLPSLSGGFQTRGSHPMLGFNNTSFGRRSAPVMNNFFNFGGNIGGQDQIFNLFSQMSAMLNSLFGGSQNFSQVGNNNNGQYGTGGNSYQSNDYSLPIYNQPQQSVDPYQGQQQYVTPTPVYNQPQQSVDPYQGQQQYATPTPAYTEPYITPTPVYNQPQQSVDPYQGQQQYATPTPAYTEPYITPTPVYNQPQQSVDPYYTQTDWTPTYNYEIPYESGEKSKYWGDPHLVGFDGEKYDVMGKAGNTYNMLSDQNIQYNTTFEAWGDKGATVIGAAGIQLGQDQIQFDRSGAAPTLNGQALSVGKEAQQLAGGSVLWDGNKLVVKSSEYEIDLVVKKGGANGNYIDSNVVLLGNPMGDFVAPHGLLGQTADGVKGHHVGDLGLNQGKQGGTVIDGKVDDYQVGGLWNNDFAFNRFGTAAPVIDWRNSIIGADGKLELAKDINGNVIFSRNVNVGTSAGAS